MELDELHVGDAGAGAIRQRHTVARRHFGVRGFGKHLPRSTCREQCRVPVRASWLPARADEAHTETAVVFEDGADGERVLEHAYAGNS